MCRLARISLITVVAAAVLPAATSAATRPVVHTPDGALRGAVESGHRLFQGIPYAAPPARWKPPTRVTPWRGVRNATRPGNECVQAAVFWRPGSSASWHEDCLYLNVWTPKHAGRKRPVLVWFHGGGHVNGAGIDVQPGRLTRWGRNVVVTVNYRLGAMGYLSLPGLDAESSDGKSSGNYGDLDKIEALRWVKRNIAAFGGNPKRVTIAGQSAGAGATCWLMASPAAAGLFARAVVQSTSSCGIPHDTAQARGATFAAAAGCSDPATAVACLRDKTPAQIIDAQAKSAVAWDAAVGGAAQPRPALNAFAAGTFNRVPVIWGNTRHESRAFVYEGNDMVRQPLTTSSYQATVRTTYGADADRILAEYPAKRYATPGLALAALQTDLRVCPALPLTDALAKWVPTYTYEFRDETAPGRPYMVIPSSFPIGTGHTSDVPYVWQSDTSRPLTSKQLDLSRLMIGAWSRFARAGDPSGAGLKWPRYDAGKQRRLGLLAAGRTKTIQGPSYSREHRCGFWQSLS